MHDDPHAHDEAMFQDEKAANLRTENKILQKDLDTAVARTNSARRAAERRGSLASLFASVATLAAGIAVYSSVRASNMTDAYIAVLDRSQTDEMSTETAGVNPEIEVLKRGCTAERVALLRQRLGDAYIDILIKPGSRTFYEDEHHHDSIDTPVEITSTHDEISTDEMREYLNGYPASWLQGKVSKIRFNRELYGPPSSYLKGGKTLGLFFSREEKIEIFGSVVDRKNMTKFDRVVAHEIAHGNDWRTDDNLTVDQRIELLAKVASRVLSEDRFRSGYVEAIEVAGDPQTQFALKCTEYWAEISREYFNRPHSLSYKDFVIVHDHVRKTDPQFDIEQGKRTRVTAFNTSTKI
ncbi:MAG: hypothetical protein A2848_03305 [Candidatus Magasanikbacteria bacterium RIFCSPHIGHO2_01_FULL_50_8]|uniref:Uncharacterized protein n=2 Tax=Candidatus Magasanikiibacteriota TaxID=1752731 RepID=A0A1F6LM46_9BACT|nr:MAG: hypothetical protein A2848_03305 [Candidatus Magasanikbacteria bacterium RIFCSPHIGHO2_01_FULL_50_8]OGH67679.1 MAG: hypothetical protein A3C15_02635 [Candidatus Magasanikbacteria bacterium RIFCSPHIGHO2_02_FULL_50_9b]